MAPLPPLRAVEVFEAVGRRGSVSRAAEELGVTPGAVTQQVHVLERHLKVRLVRRSGRGIELTSWGALYLQRISAGLDQLRIARQDVERARSSSHLSVSAITSLSAKWLGPLLFNWSSLHSDSTLVLDASDAEPRVDAGEVDFRVSYGPRRRTHQRHARLFTDFVTAVASPACISAVGPIRHPRDLLRRPLLWTDWGPEYAKLPTWLEWLPATGVSVERLRARLTLASSSAAVDAAIEGRGYALAQHSMIASAVASGVLAIIHPFVLPLPDSYFLAWNGEALDKPIGAAFHAWLIREARQFDYKA